MSKLAALITGPLMFSPLLAQEPPAAPVPAPAPAVPAPAPDPNTPQPPEVLPDGTVGPAVDKIAPVPAPEIAFGQQVAGMAQLPDDIKITHSGPEGNLKEEALKLRGPVHLKGDNGLEIFSDVVFWNGKEKTLIFEGKVSIYQGNMLQRGDRTVYHYETKQLDTSGMRASADPILMESGRFRVETINGKQVYIGKDAGITTNDQEDPDYWIRASETRIYPDDKVVFRNLKLYAGDTPVFWLPYLSQPLHSELGYHFIPGARSNWGPYLLNSYGIMLGGDEDGNDPLLLSKWHLDFMGRRGIGTGVELRDPNKLDDENITGFSFYYLNDLDPEISRSGVERGFVNEDRYEIELKQRFNFDLPDDATWYADANITFLSDLYYLEDFDLERYRYDPFPDNTLGLYRRDETSLLSIYGRFHLNDFYRSDTRLPEIAFDQSRRPIFGSPILHEGSTSFSVLGDETSDMRRHSVIEPLLDLPIGDPEEGRYLSQLTGYELILAEQIRAYQAAGEFGKADALRAQLVDTGFTRLHTFHDFSMPMNLGGWLSLVPHAGIGYTRYDSVDGPADNFDRMLYHLGAEASVKFSKDHADFKNEKWGLDGLLHVIQPYANWSVLSTDEFDETQPKIDRLTFTTRPRPLSPSRYTAIDDFHDWNTLRLGTRNRLITKRDNQSYEWLFLDTYMDAFMEDEENGGSFSNLYNDVRWRPIPWLTLNVETQFPVFDGGSGFTEFSTSLTYQPHPDFQFTLGYRILDNHPVLVDSNRIDLTTFSRIAEGWGFGTRHTLELDDNTLEVQQYTIHRDLGNWVAGVGITHRDNRLKDEYGVMFSLTLRDLPSATLPFELDAQ